MRAPPPAPAWAAPAAKPRKRAGAAAPPLSSLPPSLSPPSPPEFGARDPLPFSRRMRQGKVSDLIHSSEAYPDCQSCQVAVHFHKVIDQPNGSFTVVPGSEFSVTREARKDNSSKYWLNTTGKDKVSSYKDVTTYLRQHGIDLDHNRFLILQGEVEQIAMMKPKAPSPHEEGLLEYLEDIIGSNRLVEPITEALKAMEALNESRASTRGQHSFSVQLRAPSLCLRLRVLLLFSRGGGWRRAPFLGQAPRRASGPLPSLHLACMPPPHASDAASLPSPLAPPPLPRPRAQPS